MSLIKFVELERTMQRVHLNKSRLDLMKNGGAKAVDFYCECKKVWPLRIWSCRTVECCSNQSTHWLSWLLGLEWNKYRKDLSQLHQAFKSQACHGGLKLFFSIHFLCLAFLSHSHHSRQQCKVYMKGASPLLLWECRRSNIAEGVQMIRTYETM